MDNKKILFKEEARAGLKKGIDKVADAVKVTLGYGGRTVVISETGFPARTTKDGVTVANSIKLRDEIEDAGAKIIKETSSKTADDVGDGPQPIYSNVLTPYGFVKMGDLKKGDKICGTNGTIQKVLGVFPKGEKEVYVVNFTDGRSVECCEDHLWSVTTRYGSKSIITTKKMVDSKRICRIKDGHKWHFYYTPFTKVEFIEDKDKMCLDPYLIGILLGDGSLSGTGAVELSLGVKKKHIIGKIILPQGIVFNSTFVKNKNCYRIKISGRDKDGKSIYDLIKSIGLFGSKSSTKFIPHTYLYSSLQSREKLFQGLIDTDGYINKRGMFEFSTISKRLANDFLELSRGLGMQTKIQKMERNGNSYSDIPIYRLIQRKGYNKGLEIDSINSTGKTTKMQCIKVSNPDNLYITDDYVVTHNTTTVCVLMQALISGGLIYVSQGANPVLLKRGMELGLQSVVDSLKTLRIEPSTDLLRSIATVSANNDKEIGQMIGDAYEKLGQHGTISIEDAHDTETMVELVEGFQFDSGFMSHHFITNYAENTCELKNPYIMIVEGKISDVNQVFALMNKVASEGRSLVIIAEDFDHSVPANLVRNRDTFKSCLIKYNFLGDTKQELMYDLCAITGAKIAEKQGDKMEKLDIKYLGECEKIVIGKDETIIIKGRKSEQEIQARISDAKVKIEKAKHIFLKQKQEARMAKLSGCIAICYVGGATELEVSEKKDRIDDSVKATKAAIEEGIVPGGGTALLRCINSLAELKNENEVVQWGINLVKMAIEKPAIQICLNVGGGEEIVKDVKKAGGNFGYNAITDKIEDLVVSGIVDPLKVVRVCIENAVSSAAQVLTSEALIVSDN